METPLISIIIPTYNRAHLIGETLDSVLAQTYQNWECLVVDDGSTDNTEKLMAEYIAKDARFQFHHRPKDRLPGGNAARNYGFEMSKGAYVNWFDSDDVMHPEKLKLQVELLVQSKKVFCVCQTLVFNEKLENIVGLRKKHIFSDDPLNDFIRSKITWLTQAPIFLKSFLNKNQLKFDENLLKAQEYEFFIRVLNISSDYAYTNKPLVYLRTHTDRISNDNYEPLKSYSAFKASFNSLRLVQNFASAEAKADLMRRMVKQMYISLQNNQVDMAKKMKNEFLKISSSTKNTVLLQLGFFIYQISGNMRVLSFLASKKRKTFKSFLVHKV
ncbi:glycosyltransferase family 2 protein [Aequorivita marina]|uniref:glycosyltransferase family 2 protein n=1 Tax=Aequorivita marina TaxID=3073654 RepID=UPI0028744424|nr:glycosyltransferase family A protein [Aequorivita sp. S2608]MDS1298054.1 glycosyltransferase family A protein [Aequorivita sp. S2608]